MSSAPATLSARRAFGWILLVAVLAHGLLPLCTIVVSDDWFSLLAYKEASLSAAWQGAIYLSMPLTVLQALPFFLVGDNLLVLRLIDFAVVVALGQMVFLVLSHLAPTRRFDAAWVAAFTVAVPGYLVHFMVSFLFYPLGLLLFLTALWLMMLGEEAEGPTRRRRFFVGAAALVFYSFHFGALLVFFLFFVAAHAAVFWRRSGKGLVDATLEYLALRYWLLALPLLFWLVRQAFGLIFPTWEQYNQPALNGPVILEGLRGFGSSYLALAESTLFSWWFLAPLLLGLLGILWSRAPGERPVARATDFGWAMVGGAVLLVGILPFVLVGKSPVVVPAVDGMSAFDAASQQILAVIDRRMHLFLGLAVGLVAVHGLRWLAGLAGLDARVVTAGLVAMLAACIAADVRFYLQLEKRALVMDGLRENLRARPELKQYGIVGVVDRIDNISTTWDSWPLFFETVWGDRGHHGVPELWYGRDKNSRLLYEPATIINQRLYGGAWFRFFQAPPGESKQATLIVAPGERYFTESDAGAVLLHQFYRFFSPARHRGYAKKFTRVTVIPKLDAVGIMQSRAFGARWAELERVPLAGASQADNVLPSESFALRVREQRSHVLVLVEPPSDAAEIDRMGLVNQTGRPLPLIRTRRTDGLIALVGLTAAGDQSIELVDSTLNVKRRCPWKVAQVRQQPEGAPVIVWALPQAFYSPEAFFPDAFRGCWQGDTGVYASLFGNPVTSADGRAVDRDGEVVFSDSASGKTLASRMIPIDPAMHHYLRVDWSAPNRSASVLITDPAGRRLLAIPPPPAPAVRDYLVPNVPGWTSLRLVFRSSGGLATLPRSVQLVQGASLSELRIPVAEIFPPSSATFPSMERYP
ncbi:MAG: hypothetical protein HZA32_18640 [Opitutae bacterium]|nr:hypothetical protein [Opitutae bacterium]